MRIFIAVLLLLVASFIAPFAVAATVDADLPPLSPLTPPTSPTIALPKSSDAAPTLLIYSAKGAANACGQGCDRWIAIEGNIDSNAATRVAAFFDEVKDSRRPIYFNSPGGELAPSLEIGRLLRGRKLIGRVGQTIALSCMAGTQIDAACLKIKESGGEIEAKLTTQKALCASACVYILLGAVTREVAPDAGLAVHDAKLFLKFRVEPTRQQREMTEERLIARSRRELSTYVAAMGIAPGLLELTRSVPFEKAHLLTRAELLRFGIDKRSFAETPWQLTMLPNAHVAKRAVAKTADGTFRQLEWQIYCSAVARGHLIFLRQIDGLPVAGRQIRLVAEAHLPTTLALLPMRLDKIEIWQARVSETELGQWAAAPQLRIGEGIPAKGEIAWSDFAIDTVGLGDGLKLVAAVCPKPNISAAQPSQQSAPTAQMPNSFIQSRRSVFAPSATSIGAGSGVGRDIVFGKPPVFVPR